jgi:flagella basal body P-ring formation protein FlgA
MNCLILLAAALVTPTHGGPPHVPVKVGARQLAALDQQWRARYQQIDPRRVVKVAQRALAARLGQHFQDFKVTPVGHLSAVNVRAGQISFTPRLPPGSLLRPRLAVTVDIDVDGAPAERVPVWFRLKVLAPVLVFSRDLPQHALLGTADVRLARRDLTQIPADTATDYAKLPGRWLTRSVRAGDPVLDSELVREPLVRRNEHVKVLLTSGAIAISASGVAARSGYRGDTVKVLVDGAKAPCLARVIRPGVVKIVY